MTKQHLGTISQLKKNFIAAAITLGVILLGAGIYTTVAGMVLR
jgi:hypothetical protein